MKTCAVFFILSAAFVCALYAQPQPRLTDVEPARQYALWARQMIDEGRWEEALAGLERAMDYADVSSDISWLFAFTQIKNFYNENRSYNRFDIIETLDRAIEINRWEIYNEGMALFLKAEQLIITRRFSDALFALDKIEISFYPSGAIWQSNDPAADIAYLRLLAFRGLADSAGLDSIQALARFRSLVLQSMDRYPRDPRPLRVFLEYARNKCGPDADFNLAESDINLLELVLRRLPFLVERDADLAWLAAPFMRDIDAARRLTASYRVGSLSHAENFKPAAGSIAAALNLGLIGDMEAVEELFGGSGSEESVLYREIIVGVYNMLRSEEGRDLLTRRLLSFSGMILSDNDGDGHIDNGAFYNSGFVSYFMHDKNQSGDTDLLIQFAADGTPEKTFIEMRRGETELSRLAGLSNKVELDWERYPSVLKVKLLGDVFLFRPADFQFAPISFIELGGSQRYTGLVFPVPSLYEITRRTLVSSCVSLTRASLEFDGAVETIYLERGIPLRSVETLNGRQISVAEFERGFPVIQYVDMDMDGRMETIRRFYPPAPDFPENFDIRKLLASSESDWTGDGRHKTGEVYREDGSIVYKWDMDGSGIMNYYYETESGNR